MAIQKLDKTNGSLLLRRDLTREDLRDASVSELDRALLLRVPDAEVVAKALAEIAGRPLADRILVLPLPPDERYGQIYLPENAQGDQTCGIVVAVGRGAYRNGVLVAPEVTPGNFVMFSKYSSRTLKIGNIEVFQIVEADITFAAGK